ncbi:MAG TPA: hypothetical protein VJI15_03830 [Candidatus Nanoarchaeia archaeon]|nr:hypothetical protein [Candidatus Nanoarchaeia archaeon]
MKQELSDMVRGMYHQAVTYAPLAAALGGCNENGEPSYLAWGVGGLAALALGALVVSSVRSSSGGTDYQGRDYQSRERRARSGTTSRSSPSTARDSNGYYPSDDSSSSILPLLIDSGHHDSGHYDGGSGGWGGDFGGGDCGGGDCGGGGD